MNLGLHITIYKIINMDQGESEIAQLCPTLCNPMDCSLTGSSVHGIFQARVLEWGARAEGSLQKMATRRQHFFIPQIFFVVISFSVEGDGTPLQYSCLENPMDGGALVGCSPWGL